MSFDSYDYLIKCLIIGDSGIGKSSLMVRFTDDMFIDKYISTIGVDFKIKTMSYQNKNIKFQIWDTAGQDRFRTITSSYYRGSNAILLCYDITELESFTNLKKWMEEVKMFSITKPTLILCGTKCDLESKRQVSKVDGEEYAKKNKMFFFETSSKNNLNVKNIFELIAEKKILSISNSYDDIHKKNNINSKKINLQSSDSLFDYHNLNYKKSCC
jgi:Ras-related protein Rab-1A